MLWPILATKWRKTLWNEWKKELHWKLVMIFAIVSLSVMVYDWMKFEASRKKKSSSINDRCNGKNTKWHKEKPVKIPNFNARKVYSEFVRELIDACSTHSFCSITIKACWCKIEFWLVGKPEYGSLLSETIAAQKNRDWHKFLTRDKTWLYFHIIRLTIANNA